MRKHIFIIILLLTFLSASSVPLLRAVAAEKDVVIAGREVLVDDEDVAIGLFAGVGPALGFEIDVLKAVGGGMSSQIGYRFSNRFSALLQADIYYTRDRNVDYLAFPIAPTANIYFDNNFFAYIGAGYTWIWASAGAKFGSNVRTASKSYNGWLILAGAGYDIWISNKWAISPQVGFDYIRIASSDLLIPLARVNFNIFF